MANPFPTCISDTTPLPKAVMSEHILRLTWTNLTGEAGAEEKYRMVQALCMYTHCFPTTNNII